MESSDPRSKAVAQGNSLVSALKLFALLFISSIIVIIILGIVEYRSAENFIKAYLSDLAFSSKHTVGELASSGNRNLLRIYAESLTRGFSGGILIEIPGTEPISVGAVHPQSTPIRETFPLGSGKSGVLIIYSNPSVIKDRVLFHVSAFSVGLLLASLLGSLLFYFYKSKEAEKESEEELLAETKENLENIVIPAEEIKPLHHSGGSSEALVNMGHEIRTPMNAILGMIDLLKDSGLNQKQMEYCHVVEEAGSSLSELINGLLDFSKLEAGKMKSFKDRMDIYDEISSVSAFMGSMAKNKGLVYEFQFGPAVPRVINGDAMHIRQVIVNLIGNAIKFTEHGYISLKINQEARNGNSCVLRFEITDSGVGISEELLASIFDPFVQEDASLTRRHGGTGLGLSISKKLVELMGGSIYVRSKKNEGSVFGFLLPFEVVGDVAEEHCSHDPVCTSELSCSLKAGGARILVVEDDSANLFLIETLLKKMNFSVGVARDGIEAIEQVRSSRWDLILMDIQMPRMDGITACRAIKENSSGKDKTPPVFALTANVCNDIYEQCVEAGMEGLISKPIKKTVLAETVKSCLERKLDL